MAVKKTVPEPGSKKTPVPLKPIAPKAISAAPKKPAPTEITAKCPPKKEKMMKPIFRGLTMSATGKFINSDKLVTHEQVAKYITAHGGDFESVVTNCTTHLICSIEDFKKKTTQVKKALELGPKCVIVVFDWIIDCLLGPKLGKRLLQPKRYTLHRTLKVLKKGKTSLAEYRAEFKEGVRESRELCNNELNHVYYDPDGFVYKVVLTRVNSEGRVMTEKYTLFLFESNCVPHTYMWGAKYSRSYRRLVLYKEECYPMLFSRAFQRFRTFFQEKTGIDWDRRLEKNPKTNPDHFVYTPPVVGWPIGLVPWGYIRPELREDEEPTSGSETSAQEDHEYDTDSEVEDEDDSSDDSVTQGSHSAPAYSQPGDDWQTRLAN